MTRDEAIDNAISYFDSGAFLRDLQRRVRMETESQEASGMPVLWDYLSGELVPSVQRLGFETRIVANPVEGYGPFLLAARIEDPALPTVLIYGHGDVVRGYAGQWKNQMCPWNITIDEDRWYGRGTADNKGQHTINLAALEQVMAARNQRLNFNVKLLIEMGEEAGSPGLQALCEQHKETLAADLLVASDGPRASAATPCVFLGSRGLVNFTLSLNLRDGAHHSGNWGGLLRNPGTVLANAIASIVDARGRILVEQLCPRDIPEVIRHALKDVAVGGGPHDPAIDPDWGEPFLTAQERVYSWNALEVLAFTTGNPANPVGAIPPTARAHCQLRYVVGTDAGNIAAFLRSHLDRLGFSMVEVEIGEQMDATRLPPDDPWVEWALDSLRQTTGKKPDLLPNLGGSIPNHVFMDILGMPTIWIPHSYSGCSQHAPNEHLLASVAREALQIMAGLFWDLGENGATVRSRRQRVTNHQLA
ncbi:Succinyl-diaminopimelate desuccinylase [Paraburkholderia phenoliruptrix]|uniref:Succinyl-diaminopimelate desuccinylase n=1 Tax=Paraburkholderia phenoliruptrix TaxID=252970 RepID=A0A6J5BCI1_9BURK|nr:M20 family metallopeptidase [Paraburkholderia phenoliruptrix]CAB3701078.1 Succinyl-diaminopimelate desuccinylase [Paraburkholderia phenoliruptrix]